ncbi:MAG: hypothetical protein MO846_06200 [Candidatus Devosia symbiotica]|nr:hypothetical protein [Candidatus Devosia symbiotica]
MKPSISIITIGVDDLERACIFYRALFDSADEQISADEDHVACVFDDGLSFVLFEREQVAQTARKAVAIASTPGFVRSY